MAATRTTLRGVPIPTNGRDGTQVQDAPQTHATMTIDLGFAMHTGPRVMARDSSARQGDQGSRIVKTLDLTDFRQDAGGANGSDALDGLQAPPLALAQGMCLEMVRGAFPQGSQFFLQLGDMLLDAGADPVIHATSMQAGALLR